jgi:cyclase
VTRVAIADSGVANVASVQAAFARLGIASEVTADPSALRRASHIVVPGVGAFGSGMAALRSHGLDEVIVNAVSSGTPLLAICLGLQLLCESSDESAGISGLGILDERCTRLPDEATVPHLGWNVVEPDASCRMLSPMEAAFANSFALREPPSGWNVAWTCHGARFVAAVERGRTVACQFHPELSGHPGLRLIERWLTGVAAAPGGPTRRPGLAVRIVPCLDVSNGRVVKGIRFGALRDAGDPAEQAARYEQQGADEVVLLDIDATPSSQSTHVDIVRRVRRVLGIPLTVGGGVRSVDDARRLLEAGADKVCANSAAVRTPRLIAELAESFGSQCTVLAIDARRGQSGWDVLLRGGRDRAEGVEAVDWARRGTASGAGEILLTSWDRDGTREGCDLDLLSAVTTAVQVPIIASGGIGTREHVVEAVAAGAHAVLAASVLHFGDETVTGMKSALRRRGMVVRA